MLRTGVYVLEGKYLSNRLEAPTRTVVMMQTVELMDF